MTDVELLRELFRLLIADKASKELKSMMVETLDAAIMMGDEASKLYDPKLDTRREEFFECVDVLKEMVE